MSQSNQYQVASENYPKVTHDAPHGVGHIVPFSILFGVFAALTVLTVVTYMASLVDFGEFNLIVALAIAVVKASLVVLFFMHLRWDKPFNAIVFVGCLIFVGLFISLALLDADRSGRRPSLLTGFRSVTRNPITIAALAGVLLSLVAPYINPDLLAALLQPVQLVGNMAVPAMLIAFGISLRRGPKPGAAGSRAHVATLVGLKLVFQPIVAIAVGYAAVGLRGTALFAAAVTAALPTAQNVFTYANTYRRATVLARDAIFVSTFLSVPVILLIALLFRGTG